MHTINQLPLVHHLGNITGSSFQMNFISVVLIHNISCLKVFCLERPYIIREKICKCQVMFIEQALGYSGKEEVSWRGEGKEKSAKEDRTRHSVGLHCISLKIPCIKTIKKY